MEQQNDVVFVFPIIRKDYILDALRSLHKGTSCAYKTIVVDQTQPDWEFSSKLWDLCDIVVKPHLNYGFAAGSNMGLRLPTSEYVAVVNDDVLFIQGHDWWKGCIETFERFPKAAAVNPRSAKEPGWGWAEPGYRYLVPKGYPDEQLQRLGAEELKAREEFRQTRLAKQEDDGLDGPDRGVKLEALRKDMLRLRAQLAPLVEERALSDPKYTEMLVEQANWAVVDAFACWCTVFRADRLEEVGLFDERFVPGGSEDYDMMARIYYAKYRALSTSRSWVWHWWGQSKDSPHGFDVALPLARKPWNKLSTKGFGSAGLYDPDCDCWSRTGTRTDPVIFRAPL